VIADDPAHAKQRAANRGCEPRVAGGVIKLGGTGGGGRVTLTPVGQKLIQHYHSIEMRTRAAARREFRALGRLLHG
jgi:hypothetical protein